MKLWIGTLNLTHRFKKERHYNNSMTIELTEKDKEYANAHGLSYEDIDVNNIRITVDFIEDLIMARKLSKFLKEESLFGSAQEIINIFREKPEIFSINQFRQIEFKKNQQLIVDTYK